MGREASQVIFAKKFLVTSGWGQKNGGFKCETPSHRLELYFEGVEARLEIESDLSEEDGGEGSAIVCYDLSTLTGVEMFFADINKIELLTGLRGNYGH